MKNQVFKSSIVIAISIIFSAALYRTKPEFYFDKDSYATVRINRTNGERCLLADGVFRTWSVDSIQKEIERIKYELNYKKAPLEFCSGEISPLNIKLK
jgi:hypothetical protein